MKHLSIILSMLLCMGTSTPSSAAMQTAEQQATVRSMANTVGRMVGTAARMPATAIANPAKAQRMADSLEAMGNELERLGDSLEALTGDTILSYEDSEADDELANILNEEFTNAAHDAIGGGDFGHMSRLERWLTGVLGIGGGLLGITIAILVCALLFVIFTTPLWLVALIAYIIYRNTRRSEAGMHMAMQGAAPVPTSAHAEAVAYDTWRSGVNQTAVGLGLAILFAVLDLDLLCGIAALVTCLGVAKLIISRRKVPAMPEQPQQPVSAAETPSTASETAAATDSADTPHYSDNATEA